MPEITTIIAVIVGAAIGLFFQYLIIKSAVGTALSEHREIIARDAKLAETRAKYTGPQVE
jgi:hypothetical protein